MLYNHTDSHYVKSSKEYGQGISRKHDYWYISLRHSISYTKKRWNKYYLHMVFPKNCYHYNDALQKHESNGSLTWWRHRLLQNHHWSLARRYISTIFVYTLPRLRTSNIHRSNKRKWFHIEKRQEADNIPQKLWQTQTMQII